MAYKEDTFSYYEDLEAVAVDVDISKYFEGNTTFEETHPELDFRPLYPYQSVAPVTGFDLTALKHYGHDHFDVSVSPPLKDLSNNRLSSSTLKNALGLYSESELDEVFGTEGITFDDAAQVPAVDLPVAPVMSFEDPRISGLITGEPVRNIVHASDMLYPMFTGETPSRLDGSQPVAGSSSLSGRMATAYVSHQAVSHPQPSFGQGTINTSFTFNHGDIFAAVSPTGERHYVQLNPIAPLPISIPQGNQAMVNAMQYGSPFPISHPNHYPAGFTHIHGHAAASNTQAPGHVYPARPIRGLPSRDTKGKCRAPPAINSGPQRPAQYTIQNQAMIRNGLLTPCGSQPPSINPSPPTPFSTVHPFAFRENSHAPVVTQLQASAVQDSVQVASGSTPQDPLTDALLSLKSSKKPSTRKRKRPVADDRELLKCRIDGCGATFSDKNHIPRHILSCHTTECLFVCPNSEKCNGELFSRDDSLRRHFNNIDRPECYDRVLDVVGPGEWRKNENRYHWEKDTLKVHFNCRLPRWGYLIELMLNRAQTKPQSKRRKAD
ncbi:hypothetical protein SCHPADRAFT_893130 [Schizopora paradoxa]|uniref:C2H2-type domain-containing protein n=1 Tax=Schizopora paradoxa TaxID=27342 RepID=A0A0H2RD59_9AGAM|nr:hypothetical protein SCHPADRAFT_893130 [Schizopora paradoxa]